MNTIRFGSNSDLIRGLRILSGKFPLILIDGITYAIPMDAEAALTKLSIRFERVNGGKSIVLMDKLKRAMLEDA